MRILNNRRYSDLVNRIEYLESLSELKIKKMERLTEELNESDVRVTKSVMELVDTKETLEKTQSELATVKKELAKYKRWFDRTRDARGRFDGKKVA